MAKHSNYDVIVAGGGPAGSSAAIHLATRGARVLLVEQKKFPRAKLCGEFISPECALHFERLGVIDRMLAARPAKLSETVFYSRHGKSVSVPSAWFGSGGVAFGLSRAEMDERLLRRASDAGAQVIEDASVTNVLIEATRVKGIVVKHGGTESPYHAAVTLDATGRSRALARRLEGDELKPHRAPLVAFKAHFSDTQVAAGACEIYFYRGGYGGLSSIESGLSNLCFIASAADVRRCGADAERVMREVVCQNRRAAETLRNAHLQTPWLAVTLEKFGRHKLSPAKGLFTIGDAASFIDPFTGSGMLMAMESGELAATVVSDYFRQGTLADIDKLSANYQTAYAQKFESRLRVCSLMRRAAFAPGFAGLAIRLMGISAKVRHFVARGTRRDSQASLSSLID